MIQITLIIQGQTDRAQNALQREWGNFPFANWNGICWGLPLQLVQLIKIHFLPHLESFMWERKFEKKFFKKSHIQTPNGVLLIFKLPFPNGSYRNGVCRALWAISLIGTKNLISYRLWPRPLQPQQQILQSVRTARSFSLWSLLNWERLQVYRNEEEIGVHVEGRGNFETENAMQFRGRCWSW